MTEPCGHDKTGMAPGALCMLCYQESVDAPDPKAVLKLALSSLDDDLHAMTDEDVKHPKPKPQIDNRWCDEVAAGYEAQPDFPGWCDCAPRVGRFIMDIFPAKCGDCFRRIDPRKE